MSKEYGPLNTIKKIVSSAGDYCKGDYLQEWSCGN